jgi:hypothetical protein
MVNSRGVARLGMLAVGLGIGAAVASTPGVARADDFQISIDGMDLFSTVGNTATAYSGSGDIAIAYGDGASASAVGGTGDFALAAGSDADAGAGGSDMLAGAQPGLTVDTGADDDTAIDIGNNTSNDGNFFYGSFAGNDDIGRGADGGTNSGDTAIDIGNNSQDADGSPFGLDGARAGAGGLLGGIGTGDDDTAVTVGPNGFVGAGGGNDDVGSVFDPSGTDGSVALAGFSGDSDLSAVFGDGLSSTSALGGNFLYDILSPFGDLPGSAAATSGGFLAELLSLFGV